MVNIIVSSGVSSTGTVVSSGDIQCVLVGGTPVDGNVETGGTSYVQGTASGTVSNGGVEHVQLGGATTGTIVSNGGRGNIYLGGTARGLVLSAGSMDVVYAGGTANFTRQSDGHGRTLITDPRVDVSSALSQPH